MSYARYSVRRASLEVLEDKVKMKYRVIHKYLRDFLTLLRNNQDRHGRKEHLNR